MWGGEKRAHTHCLCKCQVFLVCSFSSHTREPGNAAMNQRSVRDTTSCVVDETRLVINRKSFQKPFGFQFLEMNLPPERTKRCPVDNWLLVYMTSYHHNLLTESANACSNGLQTVAQINSLYEMLLAPTCTIWIRTVT